MEDHDRDRSRGEVDLARRIDAVMSLDPAAPAVQYGGQWRTWGDLRAVGDAMDKILLQAGVGEGTTIGLVLRNRPVVVGAVLGALRTQRCIMSLSPIQPDQVLATDIRTLRPYAVVASSDDWAGPAFRDAVETAGAVGVELSDDPARPVKVRPGLDVVAEEGRYNVPPGTAVSMLTSGTTGPPKRVPLSYTSFWEALVGAREHITGSRDDGGPQLRTGVTVLPAPLVHIGGLFGVVMTAVDGRRLSLLERFDVWEFAKLVNEHQVIATGLPPAGVRMLLDARVPKELLSSVRAFRVGTAPLDPELAQEFERTYGIPVLITYGATEFVGEVAGWTIRDHRQWADTKRGSVGRPHRGVELKIVDVDTGSELGPNEMGVLVIKAPHAADAEGRWLKTNDLARIDDDGFLWIDGRADDVIIRGGFKVPAGEVQKALETHPSVLEAAVVGIADRRLGEVPAAAVVLRNGAPPPSEHELVMWAKERLAPYKAPVTVRVVDDLPRNAVLKFIRPELKRLLSTPADAGA